jgi:flagella basal body P-ring formation protein FlgA
MLRDQSLSLAIMLAALAAGAGQCSAAEPRLRAEAQVAGDLVRIGDLVTNAGAVADAPIFRAPDPGHTGEVATVRVIEALRPHGLAHLDTGGLRQVTVTRLGRSISADAIEQRVAAALAGQRGLGEAKSLAIAFDREVQPLHLDIADGDLTVALVRYDPQTTRFVVGFELDGGERRLRLRYMGTVVETVSVAVVARPIARGGVIEERDVVVERRPKAAVVAAALDRPEQIVGLAARRPLQPAQPIRPADLMKPELVRQNEPVLVVYETVGVTLSLRGKALDSGAEGDLVNVLNIHSKRTMQGRVTGPGRVSVASTTPQVAAAPPRTTSIAAATPPQRAE